MMAGMMPIDVMHMDVMNEFEWRWFALSLPLVEEEYRKRPTNILVEIRQRQRP